MAKRLLGPDSEVICIARSENEDLRSVAYEEGFGYHFFRFDLNELDRIGDFCAETPFAGMSAYCSSKAGLNMFTECVSMEQQNAANPVRLVAVYPGMIDTGMQSAARNSEVDRLPTAHFFRQAYDEGTLETPEQTAEKIIRLLKRGSQDTCIVKQLD